MAATAPQSSQFDAAAMAAGSSTATHRYQLSHAIVAATRVGVRGGASRRRTGRTWLQGNNTGKEKEKELHAVVVALVLWLLPPPRCEEERNIWWI